MSMKVFLLKLWECVIVSSSLYFTSAADDRPWVSNASWEAASFSPVKDRALGLSFKVYRPNEITLGLYDSDGGLVRELLAGMVLTPGEHRFEWDGKDWEGRPVPDEAYHVVIRSPSGDYHDPESASGSIAGDLRHARFDQEAGTIVYSLPAPARVLVRLGIKNGPMHKTLVDWKPRVAGSITEYWDGRDEDGVINLRDQKDFNALITYVTLPEATVITYGNTNETYREYKLGRGKDRPQKPKRERQPPKEGRLAPEGMVPPAWARAPKVSLNFPAFPKNGTTNAISTVSDAVAVQVDVDPTDKEHLLKEQFEIIFYVDNVFFAEAERGYLPYNWRWELDQIPAGEHVLTVNVSSFRGQVGVASRKVKVVKPGK